MFDEKWKTNLGKLTNFKHDGLGIRELFTSIDSASFDFEKDQSKITSSFAAFKAIPSPDSFLSFMLCLFKLDSTSELQTEPLIDLAVGCVLEQLPDDLKNFVTESCLISLSLFSEKSAPPIINQILYFQVPLESGSQIVKHLTPFFLHRLSTSQQISVIKWLLNQNELRHLSISKKPELNGYSLSDKMNWISQWLVLLSQQDFQFQSPFISLHLSVCGEEKRVSREIAIEFKQQKMKTSIKVSTKTDPQGAHLLAALIEWELGLDDISDIILSDIKSFSRRYRMPLKFLETLCKKKNVINLGNRNFADALNSVKHNVNASVSSALSGKGITFTRHQKKLDALILTDRHFIWINTVKRPAATGLEFLDQPRPSAPIRSKRKTDSKF